MQVPPEISFHGIDRSETVEAYIRERIEKLEHLHDHIIACRVAVGRPQKSRNTGNPFRCRVELSLPRKAELVATKEENAERDKTLRTVVARTFDAIEKQLLSSTSEHTRRVAAPPPAEYGISSSGIVVRLFPEDGYGFIKTEDGREFYLHRNAVPRDGFERLQVGTEVRFEPEEGEEGPQASSAQIVGKPGQLASERPPPGAEPPLGW